MSEPQIITFGCRLNTYESEVMRTHATQAGLENAIIINTCAVTAEAERQARQAIRRARKDNPEAHIIVTGCSAQINPDFYGAMPEVDRVLGNHEKMLAPSFSPIMDSKILVSDIMEIKETASHLVSSFEGIARAFVQVQNGCNHRCTFCDIPFGRGNNRSVPMGVITTQIHELVKNGYKEIVLTGVDITSYGEDLPGTPGLGNMMKRLFQNVPQLERLRLSSLDPVEVDEDLFWLLENEPRLMPHLHISLQAGDNMILKRMKRRHLREDVIHFCEKVRRLRPDVTFGADIIAGFPTETEEMFQNSLKLVEDCGLTYLHVFPYSPRPNTPAARMPQVQKSIIKERAKRLRDLGEVMLTRYLETLVGTVQEVMTENPHLGRTQTYALVQLPTTRTYEEGMILKVRITGVNGDRVMSEEC